MTIKFCGELFQTCVGYENYLISRSGKILSINHRGHYGLWKIAKTWISGGYHQLRLCENGTNKTWRLHRLIAVNFIPNPENLPVVNHINGIKTDNRIENLEWCTPKQNVNHWLTTILGKDNYRLLRRGENNGRSVFTEEQVVLIKNLMRAGISNKAIAEYFKTNPCKISHIRCERTWSHIKE